MKSFFNALEAFCWDRDVDGWRLAGAAASALELSIKEESGAPKRGSHPERAKNLAIGPGEGRSIRWSPH